MRYFSQEATGIYDINEIVNKFLEAEEQNFSLFNYGTSHTVLCASHAVILRWQLLVAWRLMHCSRGWIIVSP
jgi:hypothetical protein